MKRAGLVVVAIAIAVSLSAAPQVVIVRGPDGIMQAAGGTPETDSFVLANAGGDDAPVTLVASGGFFSVSPAAFTLAPGATQTVTIVPSSAPAGFQGGQVGVFVAPSKTPVVNVPVRMFAGTQPAGTVTPLASDSVLVISGLAGTSHPGAWNISNQGNVTMQGMLTPDAAWIVPQANIVNIAPQRNGQFVFNTDPLLRDPITPLGAVITNLGMLFLKGTAPGVLQSGEVAATVVDISKVSVVPAQPPAAAPGETISFLPLVGDTGGFFTDVFFANRGTSALASDLNLYYTPLAAPAATSLLADAGPLAAGVTAWFPLAPSSLFNIANETGTVQIRGSDLSNVAVSAVRGIVPDGVNRYLTTMPVLRSDRAVVAGDRIVFAGVEKSANAHTDIVLQEAAGAPGSYTIDFFDAAGATVPPSVSGAILPFGSVNLPDAVPSGARSARVANTTSGAAKLTGFASVVDSSTFDSWTIVDSSRGPGPTSDLVLPVPAGPASSQFAAWITNASSSNAVVTIGPTAVPARREAVRRGPVPAMANPFSITLAPNATQQVTLANAPFVHISGPRGAISATGRLTATVAGRAGAFGSGVPAIAAARAAGAGGIVRHFFRANDVPGVSPPTLLLVEVANRPATARVNIGFSFPAGSLASAHVEESKDYVVPAGQLLSIPDLVRSIVGPQRDTFGNLVNVVIDVQVIGGDGRILSYLESIDASGDVTFSVD